MQSKNDLKIFREFTMYPLWGVDDEPCHLPVEDANLRYKYLSVFDRLDELCYGLENTFKKSIFYSIGESFYFWESLTPLWFSDGGFGSDLNTSAQQFEEFLKNSHFSMSFKHYDKSEFFRHLYWYDCKNLIQHLNDRINFVKYSCNDFYKSIYDAGKNKVEFEERDMIIDEIAEETYYWNSAYNEANILHGLIMNIYAILDIATKVIFEIENFSQNFSRIYKLKSSNITFGKSNNINKLAKEDTIFERSGVINKIEFLRNEIIHNGSIEAIPKLFFIYKEDKLIKKIMYCPDYNEHDFVRIKNRARFYSKRNSFNEEIRDICIDFLFRLELSIKRAITTYTPVQVESNNIPSDIDLKKMQSSFELMKKTKTKMFMENGIFKTRVVENKNE